MYDTCLYDTCIHTWFLLIVSKSFFDLLKFDNFTKTPKLTWRCRLNRVAAEIYIKRTLNKCRVRNARTLLNEIEKKVKRRTVSTRHGRPQKQSLFMCL